MSKTLIKYFLAKKKQQKTKDIIFETSMTWFICNLIYDIQGIDKKK